MATWTFDNIPFTWLRQETNSAATLPTWRRKPRIVVRPLLGTGDADIARVGYEPYVIAGPVYVASASAATALNARSGESALLTDGTTTWTATAEIDLVAMVGEPGYTGTATFTRARAL
jgi:hypothetical protein